MDFNSNFDLNFFRPFDNSFFEEDTNSIAIPNFEANNSRRNTEFEFENIFCSSNAKRSRFDDGFELFDVPEESTAGPQEENEFDSAFNDNFDEILAKVDIPPEVHNDCDTSADKRTQEPLQESLPFEIVRSKSTNDSQFDTRVEHRRRQPLTDIANQRGVRFARRVEVLYANDDVELIPTSVLPDPCREAFPDFTHFNKIQSLALDAVYNKDMSVIVSAPTGSGKTVILELAILRLLQSGQYWNNSKGRHIFKALYIAPLKSICSERFEEWTSKFRHFDLRGLEITGDTDSDDFQLMSEANMLFATPEKWDSMTRKKEAYRRVANEIKLVLIDEVHCLSDESRGSTLEAVVSRMKTMKEFTVDRNGDSVASDMRFLAVSATIPNVEDFAEWLGTEDCPGVVFCLNDDQRPVKLQNVVVGYNCPDSWNDFRFDTTLTFKLENVIEDYSAGKPTLVFVPTRKSSWTTAEHLAKNRCYGKNPDHMRLLRGLSAILTDTKLKQCVNKGVGFHHSGLSRDDRRKLEASFANAELPVLICTSGLAMGVNLPAHLVVVKGTFYYASGQCQELTETQVLQMTGRAGRPQFDTTAVAVVMTKSKNKAKYEALVSGKQTIESCLRLSLVEHLNAEIVLRTITNSHIAMEWIRSTFLYIRLMKNRKYYGIDSCWNKERIEKKIHDWCLSELNLLFKTGMITMDDDCCDVKPTEVGKLMSKYCVSHETMMKFIKLKGKETISELIELLSSCKELANETQLRTNEKQVLNSLNTKDKTDVAQEVIRFPFKGKIKTREMKVNVLIQADFGCINIPDHSLYQDCTKLIKNGQRLAKCLVDYLVITEDSHRRGFSLLLNATILAKCFRAKLWDDSIFVTKQLNTASKVYSPKITVGVSRLIANGGLTTFEAIEAVSPSHIEMFANKTPSFGRNLQSMVRQLPKYEVKLEQIHSNTTDASLKLRVKVLLENKDQISTNLNHGCFLLIGNLDDDVLKATKIVDKFLIRNNGEFTDEFQCNSPKKGKKIICRLISDFLVGIDVSRDFYPEIIQQSTSKYFDSSAAEVKGDHWTASTSAATSDSYAKELQNIENWRHICRDDDKCDESSTTVCGIRVPSKVKENIGNSSLPSTSVPSAKLKKCGLSLGPMDKYVLRKTESKLLKGNNSSKTTAEKLMTEKEDIAYLPYVQSLIAGSKRIALPKSFKTPGKMQKLQKNVAASESVDQIDQSN